MFIIQIHYTKAIDLIDQHLMAHRDFLEAGYQNDYFVASGPRHPRTGGIIISQLKDRSQLEDIIALDPFKLNDLAQYEIIEFNPVKYHPNFSVFI